MVPLEILVTGGELESVAVTGGDGGPVPGAVTDPTRRGAAFPSH